MQYTFIWLAVIIATLVIEGMTSTLVSIWFAVGGFIAMLLSFFTQNLYLQLTAFVIASAIALVLTRPIIKNKITPKKVSTNYDMLIGQKATVCEDIIPIQGKGQINYRGQIWSAKSVDDTVIEKDKTVIIKSIKGVHAVVKEEI